MRNLIISLRTYNWIRHCAGLILQNKEDIFDVMIIYKDDESSIFGCNPELCNDAIYAQRSHDLFTVGKELGIQKLINLKYNKRSISIEKLIVQLQLQIMIGGIQTLYYQYDPLMDLLMKKMSNKLQFSSMVYGIDDIENFKQHLVIDLNEDNLLLKKTDILDQINGINRKEDILFDDKEIFYVWKYYTT